MKLTKLLGVVLVSVLALTACKEETTAAQVPLKVGVMTGPEAQMTEVAVKVAKEKYGLDVQLVQFTEYTQPNAALDKKDLDANAFQTVPYLEQESKDRGYKMAVIGNTLLWPIAAYSKKIKNLGELKDGAIVAIPNNPSNTGRALLLLQAHGLIKLKDPKNLFSTENDIIENPKNIQIKQVDTVLLTRSLDDVDFAAINTGAATDAGLNPKTDSIYLEDANGENAKQYYNIIAVRTEDKDKEVFKTLMEA